jgi:hypothetical protein
VEAEGTQAVAATREKGSGGFSRKKKYGKSSIGKRKLATGEVWDRPAEA